MGKTFKYHYVFDEYFKIKIVFEEVQRKYDSLKKYPK